MATHKEALLRRTAVELQKGDDAYRQFARYRTEIRDLYEDYFIYSGGVERFMRKIDDDFVDMLKRAVVSTDGTEIEQKYRWSYLVTVYNNCDDDNADPESVDDALGKLLESDARAFLPDFVTKSAEPQVIEAYLVDPFNPRTEIGDLILKYLKLEGYTVTLEDSDGKELPGPVFHPAILDIKMNFTADEIEQLRLASKNK